MWETTRKQKETRLFWKKSAEIGSQHSESSLTIYDMSYRLNLSWIKSPDGTVNDVFANSISSDRIKACFRTSNSG